MTAVAALAAENQAYQFDLNDKTLVSFPAMWLAVAETCSAVFAAFEKPVPDHELPQFYNELNAKMCRAHSLVYRLTAFECADCPALVRGANAARVVGSQHESTQVLVVYYLLRELLKKQLGQTKTRILQSPDRLEGYLRGFEKFTASVNFVKSAFTYLHWAWQKRGLPSEHIILPTEIVALALWCEHVLDREMREALKVRTAEILRAFRQGYPLDVNEMENVKRLSLNLLLLNDPHQVLHTSIIEEPYTTMVVSHFAVEKRRYKARGPEDYVRTCHEELQREDLKSKCFLAQTSYAKVHEALVVTLISDESEYLQAATDKWLEMADDQDARRSLTTLYELLGSGTQKTWMEGAVQNHVITVFTTQDSLADSSPRENSATPMLRCIKYTHEVCRKYIVETFGVLEPMMKALEDGLKVCLQSKSAVASRDVASQLALFAADEVTANTTFAGPEGNWVAQVYKLLVDKEVFSKHYIALLRSRLLTNRFLPDAERRQMIQSEHNMVSQLFVSGTYLDFVPLCMGMIDDVLVRSPRYQKLVSPSDGDISLSPIVLQRFYWMSLLPARTSAKMTCPENVFALVRRFRESFSTKKVAPGRMLSFLTNYSVVAVKYSFGVSSVRMILPLDEYTVASLFSHQSQWKASALASKLSIDVPTLNQLLKKFASLGIMKVGETVELAPYTGTESCLNFNDHMSFLKEKIQVDPTLVSLGTDSGTSFSEPALEAYVTMILKSQGEMNLEALFARVATHEKGRVMQRRQVKQCLEKLLQRGFVARNSETDTFAFVP